MANVSIFDTRMRSEFYRSFRAEADQPLINAAITPTDSNAALERYPWLSPVAGVQEYKGYRRSINIDASNIYVIKNIAFDSSFVLQNDDIARDQTDGRAFSNLSSQLADRFRDFRTRLVLKTVADGEALDGFDGSKFFADTHNIGTGDNIMTESGGDFTIANSDGAEAAIFLITDGQLKPLIYQEEKSPVMDTDAGTKESSKAKETMWWADTNANAGFGFWWDAIVTKFDGKPSLSEIITIFDTVQERFRGFELPKARASDDSEFPHEQRIFSMSNFLVVTTTGIVENFSNVMMKDRIADETNTHQNRATIVASNFLSTIS